MYLGQGGVHVQEGTPQVVNEDNLMEAGGPLQASVRLLSGGDRDEDGKSTTPEAQPQNRAQQLQLGGRLCLMTHVGLARAGSTLVSDRCIRAMYYVVAPSSTRCHSHGTWSANALAYVQCVARECVASWDT